VPMSTLLPVAVRFAARTLVLDPPMTDGRGTTLRVEPVSGTVLTPIRLPRRFLP